MNLNRNDINELIYKTEMDLKNKHGRLEGRTGEEIVREFGINRYAWIPNKSLLGMQCRDLCSMLCGCLDGRGVWGTIDTSLCVTESLRCPPETTTALLIGYLLLFSH